MSLVFTLVLLCLQAVREIKTLGETCKYMEEQKKKLIHVQSVYIEKLSRLSGRSKFRMLRFVPIYVLFKSKVEN